MKADNSFEVTGHNRTILLTEIDGALNGYLDELKITINYVQKPNDGNTILKACTLDKLVIPAIIAALNASHKPRHVYSTLGDNPFAMMAFCAARDKRNVIEITVDMFNYWRDVLPPREMNCEVLLPFGKHQMVSFTTGEGEDPSTAFWQDGDKFYCCML